jgi:hypothetical protein
METKKALIAIGCALLLGTGNIAIGQDNGNSNNLPSNTDAFGKGSNILNLGVGLGGDYTYFGGGYSSTPNFIISYDNGTFGNVGPGTISLGGLFAYKGISYSYTDFNTGYVYNQNWYYYIVGIRSAYHWNFTTSSRFDPYIGLMLAYYDIGFKASSTDPEYNNPHDPYYYYYANTYGSYMALSLYLGARYYVSDHVGFWLELGYGCSNLSLGVCFKL